MSVEEKGPSFKDAASEASPSYTTTGTERTRSISLNLWEEPLSSLSEIGAGGFGKILIRPERKRTVSPKDDDTSRSAKPRVLETCLKVSPLPKNGSGGLMREFKILSFLKESSKGEPFYPLVFKYTRLSDNKQECIEMERLHEPLSNLTRIQKKKGIPQKPPEPQVFYTVAVQAFRCLQRLHEAGIYHGDVKPRNFVFDQDRVLKLVDFGLSQFLPAPDTSGSRESAKTRRSVSQSRFDPAGRLVDSKTRGRFEGTTKYCSPRVHEKKSAHPSDDYLSLLYFLWEWYTQKRLPWHSVKERDAVLALKKKWTGWNELPGPLAMLYNVCKSPRLFETNEVGRLLTCLEQKRKVLLSNNKKLEQ